MARHHASDPRVRNVIERLGELFLALGSVNAVAEALSLASDGKEQQRIYPNRVHGLLSGDVTRSINTATLEAIEDALTHASRVDHGLADARARIQQAVAGELANTTDVEEAVRRAADELDVPLAVVRLAAGTHEPADHPASRPKTYEPDWSWQDDAVTRSLAALRKSPSYKVGLVVPTGGGKTKISLRVILRWLAEAERTDSVVLWITHRVRLRLQARRALQQLLREPEHVPDGAATLFADRVRFVMLGDLPDAIREYGEQIGLVVVDEAHHAAAPSYQPLFSEIVAPGLFLTATPNRTDDLPIGIDEIAYTITYRALFERGCVIEPIFDPPLELPGLDWSTPDGLRDLADYLLDRADQDFTKALVAVSRRERAELLYEAIADLLDSRPYHPLSAEDVAFVHGSGTSGSGSPADFLDEFTARPRGLLVATSQLLGEGFDDPLIDAAIITYPSTSVSHLMQVAGRALRISPGKETAHIVQVRESPLDYHFEQRWLYQDISDALRPDLIDLTYASEGDLRERVEMLLERHHVTASIRTRIKAQLDDIEPGRDVHLLLTGMPYFGSADEFDATARWGALFVPPTDRQRFVHVFNDVSSRSEDIKEHGNYLKHFLAPDHQSGSLWKSYVDLVTAMEYARREISQTPYAGQASRPYRASRGTTWLRYVTLTFAPTVPPELDTFLEDAINRDEVITRYLSNRDVWGGAIRVELPLAASQAFLLSADQAEWLLGTRQTVIDRLRSVGPEHGFQELTAWRSELDGVPLPLQLIDRIEQFVRPDRFDRQYLDLGVRRLDDGP